MIKGMVANYNAPDAAVLIYLVYHPVPKKSLTIKLKTTRSNST